MVVVVDDEAAIVELVCDLLQDVGLAAVGCTDSREAHGCIRRSQPQLVILDVQMPGIDGVELFHQLRTDPGTRAIPVIFVTANGELLKQRLPDYRLQGAWLLPKPFHIDQILDHVSGAVPVEVSLKRGMPYTVEANSVVK